MSLVDRKQNKEVVNIQPSEREEKVERQVSDPVLKVSEEPVI